MSDHAAVAPHPHPLVAQLSALHHFRTYADIAVVVVVLAMTNLIAHFTTPWASVATVPAAAVGLLILVRSRGLGWAELGLGREHWKSGVGYALAAVAVVVSVIAVGALLPWTRPMFMNNNYATISGALIASMIIIPLQTVIPEELAFRGVLHGALNRAWGFRGVAAAGSLLFGLWHIATSLGLTSSNVGFTRIFGGGIAGDRGRCGDGGGCHRGRRVRLYLAAPPQRQPAGPDRTALVAERDGRTGGRCGVAHVDLTDFSATWACAGGPGTPGSSACCRTRPSRTRCRHDCGSGRRTPIGTRRSRMP